MFDPDAPVPSVPTGECAETHASEYLRRITALGTLVQQHRHRFDSERRLPTPVFDALAEAGLFRLWLPTALGGPELSPFEFMQVVEAAAALDGSIGWLVGNGGGMSRAGGYLPAEVAEPWFDNPGCFVAAATGGLGTAVPARGGYRVTGRWPFGSGIHHASIAMGLCAIATPEGAAESDTICCYLARRDLDIIDTWHVSGLRGTGSCDFTARDVFVPTSHTHRFPDHIPTQPGLLYRMPAISVFSITVAVVPLGIARAAIDAFAGLAATRIRAGSTQALCGNERIQSATGRAEALHGAARAFLVQTIEELMAATTQGGPRLLKARAIFRIACAHAAESALRIAETLTAAAGAVSLFESCPLERCVRDAQAAARHIAMSPNNYVIGGGVCLGLDPGTQRL